MARRARALSTIAKSFLSMMGFDLPRFGRSLWGLPKFARDLRAYRQAGVGLPFQWSEMIPVLTDYRGQAGSAGGHYWFQDIWAARKIHRQGVRHHVDIASRLDGFVSHLLAMDIAVSVVDILPLSSTTPGLTFIQEDATFLGHFGSDSISSLSSLNAGEHFGLGRYSDRVDPLAHLTFMSSLARVLAPGGQLYFAVPIGRERVRFNAHRVLSTATVLNGFQGLSLVSFSYVDDNGQMHEEVALSEAPADMHFGCGLFEFTK